MRVLVDMDDVLADNEKKLYEKLGEIHPEIRRISLENRTTFYARDQYPIEISPIITEIMSSKGFYLSLAPIQGSIESLIEMRNIGLEVFICTSPLSQYRYCTGEKFEWVEMHLGKEWIKRIIMTKDKTIVKANYLIDDKPSISGVVQIPEWEHILYTQPYNQNVQGKRRLTWDNWKSVLLPNS